MKLQKHLKEIIITLLVISLTAVGYASVTTVSSGDTLTLTIWNEMKDIVNSNELKLTNISSVGSYVGIGNPSPVATLDVDGDIIANGIKGLTINTGNINAGSYYNWKNTLTNTNEPRMVSVLCNKADNSGWGSFIWNVTGHSNAINFAKVSSAGWNFTSGNVNLTWDINDSYGFRLTNANSYAIYCTIKVLKLF